MWPVASYGPCTPDINLSIAVSAEKLEVMSQLATAYNGSDNGHRRTFDGRCATVEVFNTTNYTADALEDRWEPEAHENHALPQVLMQSASTWRFLHPDAPNPVIDLGPDGRPPSVARTPLVLAMPRNRADALGDKISWAQLLSIAEAGRNWWAGRGHPEWGDFTLGKTNPTSSTSALHAMIATYAAAAARHGLPLNEGAVADREVRAELDRVEHAVVHYGETTLTYLARLGSGTDPVSAVAVEEQTLYDYNRKHPDSTLVALYPSDGTFMSDEPYMILKSASPDQRTAARDFLHFLLSDEQQATLHRAGFRDRRGDLAPGIGAPGHGLRPDIHVTALPLPSPAVLEAIQDSWKDIRKPAHVLLAIDVSGSMTTPVDNGDKKTRMDVVKAAADGALDNFSARDHVGLWSFSSDRADNHPNTENVPVGPFNATRLKQAVGDLKALKPNDTALYTTVRDACQRLAPDARQDTIAAVVILTDGTNDWPDNDLPRLLNDIKAAGKDYPVRVFPIAFSADADFGVLQQIAKATGGLAYDAKDTRRIEQVLSDVINNF
jgi:Ca-activated chloride channel family protein